MLLNVLAATGLSLAGCGGGGGNGPTGPDNTVASVVVESGATALEAGATLQLMAIARNAAGSTLGGRSFTWSSSAEEVAGVSGSGAVTAGAPGPVTITATERGSGKAGSVTLTVTVAAVASVTVEPGTQAMVVGDTQAFDAVLRDARGTVLTGRAVTWSSSDGTVASVDGSGTVTGHAAGGPVTITASAEGRQGTAQVTVAPVPVAALEIQPAGPHTLEVGGSVRLDVVARDAQGNALTGRTVSWSSGSETVAAVTVSGVVTGVAPGGPVTITASVESRTATAQFTVIPVPVHTVTIAPSSATVTQGSTQQLTATLHDDAGNVLAGRTVTWTSSATGIASVSESGLVSGVAAGGPVTITATSEGRTGTAQITVSPRTAARVAVTPRFSVVSNGGSATLQAQAWDAANVLIPGPSVSWLSGAPGVAWMNQSGVAHGIAEGQAAIRAQVNDATDTAWVAVLGPNALLSTAFAAGDPKPTLTPGQTFTVAIRLDLSRVSATGDLGSVQFDLLFDPDILIFQSAQAGVSGSTNFNVPTPGTFKFSFAGTDPQGQSNLTLVTLTFQVAGAAPSGAQRIFALTYTAAPTSTGFAAYAHPVSVGGRFRIAAP